MTPTEAARAEVIRDYLHQDPDTCARVLGHDPARLRVRVIDEAKRRVMASWLQGDWQAHVYGVALDGTCWPMGLGWHSRSRSGAERDALRDLGDEARFPLRRPHGPQ